MFTHPCLTSEYSSASALFHPRANKLHRETEKEPN